MSDFLNFNVIDEIIDGTPKYNITNNADGTKGIELANEIVEQGTPLNKVTFDKLKVINNIFGYNDTIGEYNEEHNRVEFETNAQIDNYLNNQRVLVKQTNDYLMPQIGFNEIKPVTRINLRSSYNADNAITLSNGNALLTGYSVANSKFEGIIIDSQGNTIIDETFLGDYNLSSGYMRTIEMANNKILIAGYVNNKPVILIVDLNLNLIKPFTEISTNDVNRIIVKEMTNGNIMIAYNEYASSNRNIYFCIIDNLGNIVKQEASAGSTSYFDTSDIIELNNGNILIAGAGGSSNVSYTSYIFITDQDGNIIKNFTSIGTNMAEPKLLKLSNGNILMVGRYGGSNHSVNFVILDQDGNIIKSKTNLGSQLSDFKLFLMADHVLVVGHNDNALYYAELNEDGSVRKAQTSASGSAYNFNMIKLKNGNLFKSCVTSTTNTQLQIQLYNSEMLSSINQKTLDGSFLYSLPVEFNDGKILIVGKTSLSDLSIYITYPLLSLNNPIINNKKIDTLLQKDKYYELLYDEANEQFIAEEVRA